MSPEERELLNRSVSLAEENNKILLSMRRSQRWSSVMRAVYWIIIIGSAVGAYYFIQPYVDQLIGIYGGAKSNLDGLGEILQNIKR
ncbi:hypothetical protein HYW72_00620 [Candidatus Nomurabacteria bacterium]|nr:hypothetical protein [Candidatus Nomurabacteria bacterium]